MKGMRRLVGFALYLVMAFPLMLGGMALVSVKPLADDPATVKSLVADGRFTALLESPDLQALAPETMTVTGATLDGRTAVAAFQAAVPAAVIVSTAEEAIDSAYAALARGEAFFTVDARPLKQAVKAGAVTFADAYIAGLRKAGAAAAPESAVPAATERKAVAAAVSGAAEAEPDQWLVGEPGSRFEAPARIGTIGAGLAGASVWLLVTGAGLCFASVMVSDTEWRRRLGRMGSRFLVPSVIILLVGLGPRLVMPGTVIRLPSGSAASSLPALAEYLRFVLTKISGGFLTAGLVGVGLGTAFVSARRIMPPSDDEALD